MRNRKNEERRTKKKSYFAAHNTSEEYCLKNCKKSELWNYYYYPVFALCLLLCFFSPFFFFSYFIFGKRINSDQKKSGEDICKHVYISSTSFSFAAFFLCIYFFYEHISSSLHEPENAVSVQLLCVHSSVCVNLQINNIKFMSLVMLLLLFFFFHCTLATFLFNLYYLLANGMWLSLQNAFLYVCFIKINADH